MKNQKLKLQEYYEDDNRIADYLRHNCPDTRIIRVAVLQGLMKMHGIE